MEHSFEVRGGIVAQHKRAFNVAAAAWHHMKRMNAGRRFCLATALALLAGIACAQDFAGCVRDLRREAMAQGISAETFEQAMTGIEPDRTVLDAMDNQPEFKLPIWDYLA